MNIDAQLLVSNGQQITADAVSTNTIEANRSGSTTPLGTGEPMTLAVVIVAAGTNTGSLKVQAIQSANADLSAADVIGDIDLATADLVVGKTIEVGIPPSYPTKRYLGVNYDVTGTVDVTVKAWLAPRITLSKLGPIYGKNAVV
jgi:hypothetical protein